MIMRLDSRRLGTDSALLRTGLGLGRFPIPMRLDPKRLDTDPSGYSLIRCADVRTEFASVSMRLDSTRLEIEPV